MERLLPMLTLRRSLKAADINESRRINILIISYEGRIEPEVERNIFISFRQTLTVVKAKMCQELNTKHEPCELTASKTLTALDSNMTFTSPSTTGPFCRLMTAALLPTSGNTFKKKKKKEESVDSSAPKLI